MSKKWSFLRRAYAIKDYAYLRQTEAENPDARPDELADSCPEVCKDIRTILEWAIDNGDRRTEFRCRLFLMEFEGGAQDD